MRVPEKGKPDFSVLGDKKLTDYRTMVNDMIGACSNDAETVAVLKTLWKALNDEIIDRISAEVPDKPVMTVRKIRFRTSSMRRLTK